MFLSMLAGLAQSRLCGHNELTIRQLGNMASNSLAVSQLAGQPVGP